LCIDPPERYTSIPIPDEIATNLTEILVGQEQENIDKMICWASAATRD
jgi:hypothetical protein